MPQESSSTTNASESSTITPPPTSTQRESNNNSPEAPVVASKASSSNKEDSKEEKETIPQLAGNNTALLLQPPFSGFHNFSKDGPRKEPFLGGKSKEELLLESTTTKEFDPPVPFVTSARIYYAAAWLSSTANFLSNKKVEWKQLRSNWNPILEQGTWIGIKGKDNRRTVDMLDFFVHHLSRYKGPGSVGGPKQVENWNRHLDRLQLMETTYAETPFNNPNLQRNGRVLVLMPFHGATDRHSKEDEKQISLNVTIKALARIFSNIVVTVCDEINRDWIIYESGLNEYLYDVLVIQNMTLNGPMTNCKNLPGFSVVQLRLQMEQGRYPKDVFDWVYYTESDQPLFLRNLDAILFETLRDRNTIVVPHRGYPAALKEDLNFAKAPEKAKKAMEVASSKTLHKVDDIRDHHCCFNPDSDINDYYSSFSNLFRVWPGHAQITGTCNALRQVCNICKFRTGGPPCPANDIMRHSI